MHQAVAVAVDASGRRSRGTESQGIEPGEPAGPQQQDLQQGQADVDEVEE